ncbi:MAG TPA: hypothetical protein VFT32_07775, partial [Candidatus Eisenbacteria bacterium]|nr:hypothetical protein [Candidatus Eisenbacteria bacterium]
LAREIGPREFHFYAAGVDFADLAPILAPELAGTQALIFRLPHALLNPNYWEPHTKAGEDEERARGANVIVKDSQGATWLWRSNAIAPGRYLLDGIDVPVERVPGAAFKVSGPDALKLGKAWAASGSDPADRFEWLAYKAPAGNGAGSAPLDAQDDVDSFRLQTAGATMIFAATGAWNVRMAFASRTPLRACARAAMRGFMMRCTGRVVSPPNDHVCDDFLAHAERGLTSTPDPDFVSKGTAFEFSARPGLTPWTKDLAVEQVEGEDRILVYYDRVAGIWAVAS